MPDEKFYPSLESLITADMLPSNLGALVGNLGSNLLDRIFYRNLQTFHSRYGEHARYNLTLVAYGRIGIDIPGTGLALLLNPAQGIAATEFAVSVGYTWEILRYLDSFDFGQFDYSPRSFFDLVLKIAGVDEQELIKEVTATFIGGTLDDFVIRFNAAHPTTPINVTSDPDPGVYIERIVDALDAESLDAIDVLFEDYILDVDVSESLRKIEDLFRRQLGTFSKGRIEKLLVPQVEASAGPLTIGLQIPAIVLREVGVNGDPLPDPLNPGEDKPAILTFDVATLRFSSAKGLDIDAAQSLNLNFPRSELLRSGLILEAKGVKVDFSRTTNIAEASADGRPVDFAGVYVTEGTITFPAFWKQEKNTTGVIKVQRLLLGTGGISGTMMLAANDVHSTAQPVVKLKFGDDFSIALDKFAVTFKQNAITGSEIEGTLVIPGFADANDNPAEIRIKVDIQQNGDFDITAHEDQGFKPIRFPGVFDLTLKSVFFGKTDDDFYLGVSGSIKFTHHLLATIVKDPIEVEKLVIWSNGRFEIEGGTIPLPENVRFPIGPAEISISAIHLGSHERTEPDGSVINFRYFGFDGGVDINPGGVDVRGKGIKFYFPTNAPVSLSYLEIKSLAIDLVIPGSASKESATLLISGFLSVDGSSGDPEYSGGVTFALPKVKIAGGAAMKYSPRTPAFLVDAFVELSTPIPLGATSLGFRGLFGQRYVATKTAGGVQETDTWFDYYKFKKNPPGTEGINTEKFEKPDQTAGYESQFSIGAGVSLATAQDSGKAFSCRLFLLLSLPDLIYLEGKANIVGKRVGLTGDDDPPFFAVLALTPRSVELGAGVNYSLPREGSNKGQILDLKAEMRAAFFFQNSSAWYVHVGTIQNPTTARILSLFDATSYLMLSASGIVAGAGVSWGFDKSYAGGLVRASVAVYIKVGGFISFERPQIGGFAMLGGHVDVAFMWLSFYIIIDTSLMVEVPHPFYITGSVHLCVGVTIGFWKFKKTISRCFDVEFRWEREKNADTTPIMPIAAGALPPSSATNMLSGETFTVAAFGGAVPSFNDPAFNTAVLPLDTWVDIEFLKGLLPNSAVDARIGRLSGQAAGNIEYIPPAEVAHKVAHQYTIEALEIRAWSGTAWVDYRPYQAMSPPAALAVLAANPSQYKDGFWLNTGGGGGLNKIRLLAETSLSYMQQPDWYVPEQMGITSTSLFCRGELRDERCIDWTAIDVGTVLPEGKWQQRETSLHRITGGDGRVVSWKAPDGTQRSLAFANNDKVEIVLNHDCIRVDLKLTTFSTGAAIRYSKRESVDGRTIYTLVETRNLTQLELLGPVHYENPNAPVAKVEIEPIHGDPVQVQQLMIVIERITRSIYVNKSDNLQVLRQRLKEYQGKLSEVRRLQCTDGIAPNALHAAIDQLNIKVGECAKGLADLQAAQSQACKAAAAFKDRFERCFPSPDTSCPDFEHTVCWRTFATTNAAGAEITALELYCRWYKELYSRLYAEGKKRLDELTARCDALTKALIDKRAECKALNEQLSAAEHALEIAMHDGALYPPKEFPCSTLLHQVCWLSVKDHDFNMTIPGQAAIGQDYANAVEAIEKRLTPVWRPDTTYSVRLQVQDTVNGSPTGAQVLYFGFRTGGPVGYFHTDPSANYVKANKGPDEYLLTSLKGYIDYKRSYPNADGELIRSKPLFYEDAHILLFFTKRYAYHFFGDWPAYNGLPALAGNSMQVTIKDPAKETAVPLAVVSWPLDDEPRIAEDVRTMGQLRNPELLNPGFKGGDCWTSGGEMIKPASVYTSVQPQNLEPRKLYTSIVNNVYKGTTREVHRYGFQTSRYPDFKAQVKSYMLEDADGNFRNAVFRVELPLAPADVTLMFDVVSGNAAAPANAALAGQWADPFDRLVQGVLAVPPRALAPLDAAICTEFNIVRNSTNGAVVAIWIRNPEPFNDPKLPDNVLDRSLRVMHGSQIDQSWQVLFSKDRSQMFVMHPSKLITAPSLNFRFAYIEWNGVDYADHSVVITGFVHMNS